MENIHWDIYDQNCGITCLAILEIYQHYNHLNDRFVFVNLSGAPNENIVQNHLNVALLNVF